MRAMVLREYGTAPAVCEVAGPAGPAPDVLAASLDPAGLTVAAGLNPFRRPQLPLVPGMDGVARRPDGALVHFFWPAPPYGAFAERVPLAQAETVPPPGGLDPARAAAPGISGVAAWTALARTAALRPGESVLVLGDGGQVGRIAVQAARLPGARRVTAVVRHEAARHTPLRLGAGPVVTSQDLPTLTQRLLEPDQAGYDVILDTLAGPGDPGSHRRRGHRRPPGAPRELRRSPGHPRRAGHPQPPDHHPDLRDHHRVGPGTRHRLHPAGPARRGGTDRRLPRNRTGNAPAIWDDFAAGRAKTKIIVTPNETAPHDRPGAPASSRNHRPLTGVPGQGTLSKGIPADQRKPPEPARPDR